jgi:hypothetical protein
MNANTQKFLVTPKSRNAKTGPMMVTTTDSSSCPDVCPFKASGACYAKSGPLAVNWRNVDQGKGNVTSLEGLWRAVAAQPADSLWRMNQAGDLPGTNNEIDRAALDSIVAANHGKRGFTYTHKPMDREANRSAVKSANENGFTINLSANTLAHADELADLGIGPVVAVLPIEQNSNCQTPAGRTVVVCPATQRDDVSCSTCGLCQRQRKTIVGFPAHGNGKRKADAISKS